MALQLWRNEYRLISLLLVGAVIMVLASAAAALWSGDEAEQDARFASLVALRTAYNHVLVDRTTQPQLARLGFDPGHPGVHSLSGLGVQEYFMPHTSRDFDRLDPAIRTCFRDEDRCTALVIPLRTPLEKEGFLAAHAAPSGGGRIVFLLRSGRVAYKDMDGL